MYNSLTLADLASPGETLSVDELHQRARQVKSYQQRQTKLKSLRKRYKPRPCLVPSGPGGLVDQNEYVHDREARQEDAFRTRGEKSHDCSCGGSCGSCAFDKCTTLGEQLQVLDTKLELTRQQLEVQEIVKQTKEALGRWEGKSYDSTPSVDETVLRTKLLTLGWERDAVWNELMARGCSILRKDRAGSA
jgi:hypothetical protein